MGHVRFSTLTQQQKLDVVELLLREQDLTVDIEELQTPRAETVDLRHDAELAKALRNVPLTFSYMGMVKVDSVIKHPSGVIFTILRGEDVTIISSSKDGKSWPMNLQVVDNTKKIGSRMVSLGELIEGHDEHKD